MEKQNNADKGFYSPKALNLFRWLCITAVIILALCFVRDFSYHVSLDLHFFSNIICTVLLIMAAVNPAKLGLVAICCAIYSVELFIIEPDSLMAILMYFLFFFIMKIRGYYNHSRKVKLIITVSVFILLQIPKFFSYSLLDAFDSFVETAGHIFTLVCIIIFAVLPYILEKKKAQTKEEKHVLNLSMFPGLTKRDADWLTKINAGEKYKVLAIESQMSEGSVKNRIKFIYNTLQCGDRVGFLNAYSDYEIIFSVTRAIPSEEKQ